jgi:hypothetical protein
MIDIGNYVFDLLKADFPFLWSRMLPRLSGVRITSPLDGATVYDKDVPAIGIYSHTFDLKYVLFHQVGYAYYPQGSPVFNSTRKEWAKKVTIGEEPGKEYTITLAIINEDIEELMNYYYHFGLSKGGYHTIPLHKIPKGMTILQQVVVKLETRPAP